MNYKNMNSRLYMLLLLSTVFLQSFARLDILQEPVKEPVKVLVFPDNEISLSQLRSVFKLSTCASMDANNRIVLNGANIRLVAIGDMAPDGEGDFEALNSVNDVKRTYGEQVTTLTGNRDGNKVRFALELALEFLNFFRPGESSRRKFEKEKHEIDGNPVDLDKLTEEEFQVVKLKWMLTDNMGCPKLFQSLKKSGKTDVEVTRDYLAQWQPGGAGEEYLSKAQMVKFDPDVKTLFVHGFVNKFSLGYVPETEEGRGDAQLMPVSRPGELQSWEKELNARGRKGLDAGLAGNRKRALPVLELMEFKNTIAGNGEVGFGRDPRDESIIQYHSHHDGDFWLPEDECIDALRNNGCNKLVVGHTPVGQVPLIMRDPRTGFLVILIDNTYSNPLRGAATEVEEDKACIYSLYYEGRNMKVHNPGIEINIVADTRDLLIGTSEIIDGKNYWIVGQAQDGTGRYLKVNYADKRDPKYLLEDIRAEILPAVVAE